MYTLRKVLADMIRKGEVAVRFPEIDMKGLQRAIHDQAQEELRQIANMVYEEEMTDGEKVAALRDILEQWERA